MGKPGIKFYAMPLLFLTLACVIGAWLLFGNRGLLDLYSLRSERRICIERIQMLSEENRRLKEELERLRTDMDYVESLVRRELNLIRKNEKMYRFSGKNSADTNN